jgi:hypothetical protein
MIKPILHLLNQGRWQPAPPELQNIELILVGSQLINSFTGKFRSVLVGSIFKIQRFNNAELIGATGKKIAINGKCFVLTHDRWIDYRQLLTKQKQLTYRLRKLHPHFDYLWLQDPVQRTSVLIELKSHKSFQVILRGGEG